MKLKLDSATFLKISSAIALANGLAIYFKIHSCHSSDCLLSCLRMFAKSLELPSLAGVQPYTIATSGDANIKTFSKLNVVPVGLLAAASYKGKGHPALLATQAAIILAYGYIGFVE
jgi:hypothetical protein